MVPELAREWVAGWVVSRGAPPPVEEPWGLRIDVGMPGHVVRHVLPETDEVTVRKAAEAATLPGTWIKAFLAPETVASWLGDGWRSDDPGFLMATDLPPAGGDPGSAGAPEGYALSVRARDSVTWVQVLTDAGDIAARGQVAVVGAGAVVDKVETAPAHRRRGLGSVVMRALNGIAADRGAGIGVLGATVAGWALYESLGWRMHAPLAGFIHDG